MRRGALALLGVWLAALPGTAVAQDSHLVIVTGLGGDPAYSDQFHDWAVTLAEAALDRYRVPPTNIVYLGEKPDRAPGRIDDRSTKENVEAALEALATRARPGDKIFVVLIGHGSAARGEARFNLPGPDMTAEDFGRLLERFPSQQLVVANTASASGGWVEALSGPRRTILTATKTGRERNETVFGGFFVEALAGDGADVDKDDRISILEAFNYARLQVARTYEQDGRLLTEHALLDDNGDGQGSGEPDAESADGAVARALFLAPDGAGAVVADGGAAVTDPELRRLLEEQRALEDRVQLLRAAKDGMEAATYEQELETLLIELALKGRAIRQWSGSEGER